MLKLLEVPGHGQAIAGLDWLALDGVENRQAEIRQLARSANAAWQYVWADADPDSGMRASFLNQKIAFVSKADSRARPHAAAILLRNSLPDRTFLSLLACSEPDTFWVFALTDGMPAKQMDFVGGLHDAMGLVRDFISSQAKANDLPVYTDQPELLIDLPYRMDLRSMSLEVLSHTIEKKDFAKSRFSLYVPVSVTAVAIAVLVVLGVAGYLAYDANAAAQRERAAKLRDAQLKAQRLAKLEQDIGIAINAAIPSQELHAYTQAIYNLPPSIAGWRIATIACELPKCQLELKAQPLATWRGYLQAKPAGWPEPIFGSNTSLILQPIHIATDHANGRVADSLPSSSSITFDIGNLAQLSKTISLTIVPPDKWEPVAVSSGPGTEHIQIPVRSTFTAAGPAHLFRDFVRYLPTSSGITRFTYTSGDTSTFSMEGEAYALP